MERIFASIITIGDELLIGQVVDTNSAWMARELNTIGVSVRRRVAVGDVWDDIWRALDDEGGRSPIVLITGGLGPTTDDITKPLLCKYFGGTMIVHKPTLDHVTTFFETILKRPMIERNAKQAEVPDVCTVLMNERGTAPGMMFKKNGTLFVSLPGVPHEMQWLMEKYVLPFIPTLFATGFVEHRTLMTFGIGESYLAEMVSAFENGLPKHITLAYLPNLGLVRLRLTGYGFDKNALSGEMDTFFQTMKRIVANYLVTDEDIPLEAVVGRLLKQKGKTVAVADTVTGGHIVHVLANQADSHLFFRGGVVGSDCAALSALSGGAKETLASGPVNENIVMSMARSMVSAMRTDYSLVICGTITPAGTASPTVWIAAASVKKAVARRFEFRFDQSRTVELAATSALNHLRTVIAENG